ncbi:MAG: tail fiber domain-containing protein [Proteobacteria bacterium]|nr:tail fiber domain-containing protein [Pseudomonadota bacterium]
MSFVEDIFSKGGVIDKGLRAIDPQAGARVSADAAEQQRAYEERALDYMIEKEALPTQFRDQGLSALGEYYGGNQQGLIDQVQSSPFYQSMMQEGQDAVLRGAGATGGLRSGNANTALAQKSQQVLNNAVQQQLSGLSGLAGLNLNTNAIANQTSNIGSTVAQGMIGTEQSRQAGINNLIDTGTALYAAFSDVRLKENIKPVGKENGINLYSWDWNDKAEKELGLTGEAYGVMAHELPLDKLILDEKTGYLLVKYNEVFH